MLRRKILLAFTTLTCVANAIVQNAATGNEIDSTPKKSQTSTGGPLYPQATETRDLRTLDGIWNFRKSPADPESGYRAGWFEQDLDKVMYLTLIKSYSDDIISHRAIPPESCWYVGADMYTVHVSKHKSPSFGVYKHKVSRKEIVIAPLNKLHKQYT
ncbi:hypothetical protein HF086_015777 [Spodoptera exigua]|uniref:Beta-glucuronidase n=1 Tax=Spodoptera exigua TaxID=7107 RepID=A0A922S9G6_SPOEX|nr:hypothetical protein HF086_015777 [Spodoptera exigua]